MRKNLRYHDTLSTKMDLKNNPKICATICATSVTAYWWVPGMFLVVYIYIYIYVYMSSCSVQAVATQGCDEFVHCSLPLLNKQFCLWVPPCLFVGLKFCGPSGRRRATATTKHCALQRLEASPDRAHREKRSAPRVASHRRPQVRPLSGSQELHLL